MSSGILYPLKSAFCRVDIRLVAAALAGARVDSRTGRLMRQYLVINDVLPGAEARQDGLAMAILDANRPP